MLCLEEKKDIHMSEFSLGTFQGYRLNFPCGGLPVSYVVQGGSSARGAAILVFSDVNSLLYVTSYPGEEVWRCLGCGDSIAAGQRLYKTVNEAWHVSCFR